MIKLIRTDTTLDLSQKAEKSCFFFGTWLYLIDNSRQNNARRAIFTIKPVVSILVVGFHWIREGGASVMLRAREREAKG